MVNPIVNPVINRSDDWTAVHCTMTDPGPKLLLQRVPDPDGDEFCVCDAGAS